MRTASAVKKIKKRTRFALNTPSNKATTYSQITDNRARNLHLAFPGPGPALQHHRNFIESKLEAMRANQKLHHAGKTFLREKIAVAFLYRLERRWAVCPVERAERMDDANAKERGNKKIGGATQDLAIKRRAFHGAAFGVIRGDDDIAA